MNYGQIIGAQGEVRIYRIDTLPDGLVGKSPERDASGAFIISHSEKGHHHVIGGDVDVIEVPATSNAMRTLYAIVREPTKLRQTAPDAHGEIALEPGIYRLAPDREYDPFMEQARRVAD